MASPDEFRLADLKAKYDERASSPAFTRLYEDDSEFGHMFSVLHERLNQHFDDINDQLRPLMWCPTCSPDGVAWGTGTATA